MLMSIDDHFRAGVIEDLPDRLHSRSAAMRGTRGPAWFVPVGQDAGFGIRSQIRLQPGPLCAAGGGVYFGIQGIDAPGAEIIGVIRGNIIEVLEVAGGAGGAILVITGDGFGPGFAASPGWVITVCIFSA